jgi:predicted nucleic acid-binding protein
MGPHLLEVEILSVLRGLALNGKVRTEAAELARTDYFAFVIVRHELHPLSDRIWALRNNHTTYDACYLVLAEALAAPLYTCDRRLGNDGHGAQVMVFPSSH